MRRDSQGRRLCTASRADGQPCNGAARHGATVCNVHGGKAPQVIRKAHERISEAIDPVLASLITMALDSDLVPRERIAASVSSSMLRGFSVVRVLRRSGVRGRWLRSRSRIDNGDLCRDRA